MNLIEANLIGANLDKVVLGWSVLGSVDLSGVERLETVKHAGPSTVGTDTLVRSRGKIPDEFLRGCGLCAWEVLAARLYDPGLALEQASEMHLAIQRERFKGYFLRGVFISFAEEDRGFVDKLYASLTHVGANVWLDSHNLVSGPIEKQVCRTIRYSDMVLLVLSETLLRTDWMENELETARKKEKEENRQVLCPVALDESWKFRLANDSDDRQLWLTFRQKKVLDFSKWQTGAFDEPFGMLVDALKIVFSARWEPM